MNDKTAPITKSIRAPKGKKGGPSTEDRAKYGRNLSRAKNQGN
jgi:hypothetical protein